MEGWSCEKTQSNFINMRRQKELSFGETLI